MKFSYIIHVVHYRMSTSPRFGEMTATTLLSKSSSVPPVVAIKSVLGSLRPSNFSRFVVTSAIASLSDSLPPVSNAACGAVSRR